MRVLDAIWAAAICFGISEEERAIETDRLKKERHIERSIDPHAARLNAFIFGGPAA
jgi:hypothetical protein